NAIGQLIRALVNAFVVPADEQQPLFASQFTGERIVEGLAVGGKEDSVRGDGQMVGKGIERFEDGFTLHYEAVAAAVGVVVGGAVTVVRPVAQVVRLEGDDAFILGAAHHGRAHDGGIHIGE